MDRRHLLAYGLIAFGVLALLARAAGSTGWLWLGVVAAASLVAYANTRTYGFLLLGGVLAGSALGILLTDLFAYDGIFLVSLGAGLIAVDRVEPRTQRWATYLGAVLAAIGLLAALLDTGVLGSGWLPLLLIAVGVALLWRDRRGDKGFPPPQRAVQPWTPEPPAGPPEGPAAGPPEEGEADAATTASRPAGAPSSTSASAQDDNGPPPTAGGQAKR